MTAFARALTAHFQSSIGHPQYQVWFDYAASTNERGQQVINTLQQLGQVRPGMRLLDVGSGYGGVCVAAAKAGLSAVGIEIDSKLLELAGHNRADHAQLSIELGNRSAMDWDALCGLGEFDFITCDNVVEHVPMPQVLFAHLRRLCKPDGIIYLTSPNARSFGQITSECHYGQFGLSLLDPLDGEAFVQERPGNPSYDVSTYYSLAEYEDLFRRYGLHALVINPVSDPDAAAAEVQAARNRLVQQLATAIVPARLQRKVKAFVEQHVACVDADLAFFRSLPSGDDRVRFAAWLHRTYVTELWYWAASPTPNRFRPAPPPPQVQANGHDPVSLNGEMKRVAKLLGGSAKRLARTALDSALARGPRS